MGDNSKCVMNMRMSSFSIEYLQLLHRLCISAGYLCLYTDCLQIDCTFYILFKYKIMMPYKSR